ncbi:hypothetical protein BCR39DRAFT_591647 [Naematelia encephala]|uniref:Uncharacterized protein n=1 Tax=Naematelia encephala TaxID=71784 RepID=A0A1Y2AFF1_9TREE|nr:hypothetical protein BCR39DRAFT_591647 [Naematelia encephala]
MFGTIPVVDSIVCHHFLSWVFQESAALLSSSSSTHERSRPVSVISSSDADPVFSFRPLNSRGVISRISLARRRRIRRIVPEVSRHMLPIHEIVEHSRGQRLPSPTGTHASASYPATEASSTASSSSSYHSSPGTAIASSPPPSPSPIRPETSPRDGVLPTAEAVSVSSEAAKDEKTVMYKQIFYGTSLVSPLVRRGKGVRASERGRSRGRRRGRAK